MSYLLVFAVLLAIYIVGLLLLKYLVKHKTLVNVIFAIVIFASYFYVARYMYFDVGSRYSRTSKCRKIYFI